MWLRITSEGSQYYLMVLVSFFTEAPLQSNLSNIFNLFIYLFSIILYNKFFSAFAIIFNILLSYLPFSQLHLIYGSEASLK